VFDFAWSELALIGVVALIAIGPKDLPVAIKTVASMIKKARRMAGEFQTHVDEMVREANLDEVRSQINQIRNFDIKGEIEKAVDEDGSLKQTLSGNPLDPVWSPPVTEAVAPEVAAPDPVVEEPAVAEDRKMVPAFIPPEIATRPAPPAFIPPDIPFPGSSRR